MILAERPALIQWQSVPSHLPAWSETAVHLWLHHSSDPGPGGNELDSLSPAEQAQSQRLIRPHLRHHYVRSRSLLRWILARYLVCDPRAIAFSYGAHGKPALLSPLPSQPLHFNLSHSHDWVLYAISQQPLGVDLEALRPMPSALAIAERFFAPLELQTLQALPTHEQGLGFLRHWVSKEAYVKATGQGLADHLDRVIIQFSPTAQLTLAPAADTPTNTRPWHLQELTPHPDLVAALVTPSRSPVLSTWRY